jgi:uncharacterized protein
MKLRQLFEYQSRIQELRENDVEKTLYVSRRLGNTKEFLNWAESQGFKKMLEPKDLHVTLAYSTKKVDWSDIKPDLRKLVVKGGKRSVTSLGDLGAAVLQFESKLLTNDWKEFKDIGASWDYQEYTPHITITYQASNVDLSKVEPYQGDIILMGEVMKEINPNWNKKFLPKKDEAIVDHNNREPIETPSYYDFYCADKNDSAPS